MKKTISLALISAVLAYSTSSCSKQTPISEKEVSTIELSNDLKASMNSNIQNIISLRSKNNSLSILDLSTQSAKLDISSLDQSKVDLLN